VKNGKKKFDVSVIILAAGLGTRMKSSKAKVLHEIFGVPMITHVVRTAKKIAGDNVVLVIGNQAEQVRKVVSGSGKLRFALQKKQLGTGHAVLCAIPCLPEYIEQIVVLSGDVPLISADTILHLLDDHINASRDVSLLAVEVKEPKGYGRVILDENRNLIGIVEESDATCQQKLIKLINTGIYCVKKDFLTEALHQVKADNAQGEYYLTDIIGIAYKERKKVGALIGSDPEEVIGVNTREDLLAVERVMRARLRNIS
jgi:UDP-N-acetylglucosamine diphosphorylase/glucosamine-1-phosphate N-acetyltransferase